MPRKHANRAKQKEVPLRDGWTLVTRPGPSRSTRLDDAGARAAEAGSEAGAAATAKEVKPAKAANTKNNATSEPVPSPSAKPQAATPASSDPTTSSSTSVPVDAAQLEALRAEYLRRREHFRETQCAAKLKKLLEPCDESRDENGDIRRVENAVCVGLGSFIGDHERNQRRVNGSRKSKAGGTRKSHLRPDPKRILLGELEQRSLWQLVVFMEIVDMVSSTPVPLYAQDPEFTAAEEAFLGSIGITVLQVPDAGDYITESTFVYAPFVDFETLLVDILSSRVPLLYVGTDMQDVLDIIERTIPRLENEGDPDEELLGLQLSQILASLLLRSMTKERFPAFECLEIAFYGLTVCWSREPQEGAYEEGESNDGSSMARRVEKLLEAFEASDRARTA